MQTPQELIATTLLLLATAAGSVPARAQGGPPSTGAPVAPGAAVSLQQAVDEALANNTSFRAELERIGVAEGLLRQAGVRPNPTASVGTTSDRFYENAGEQVATAGLEQEIETAGKRRYRVLAAGKRLEQVRSETETAEQNLVRRTAEAFFSLLRAQRDIALAREDVGILERLMDLTGQRVKLGEAAGLDLNLAKVELARTQREVLEFERLGQESAVELNLLMGRSPANAVRLAGDFSPAVPLGLADDALVTYALRHRPDLLASAQALEAARQEERLERALRWPNVSVGAGYQREDRVVGLAGAGAPGGGELLRRDQALSLSVGVPLPLFNRNQGKIEAAEHETRSAQYATRYVAAVVESDVRAALASYRARQQATALYETSILPLLRQSLQSITEAYRLGNESIFAVIQAQRTFFDTRHEYLAALFELESERIRLNRALAVAPGESVDSLATSAPSR